jgi:hypothetical protein
LYSLINDIGLRLKSYSTCIQLRRIQDAFFHVDPIDSRQTPPLSFVELKNLDLLLKNVERSTAYAKVQITKNDKQLFVDQNENLQQNINLFE